MREVLTLQLGHYANFVGAHVWNVQNEYMNSYAPDTDVIDHDVLFRTGTNLQGEETYTPRAIVVDLKGSSGSMSVQGELYAPAGQPLDSLAWSGAVQQFDQPRHPKNDYLLSLDEPVMELADIQGTGLPKRHDLDRSVRVWSDFSKQYFHPRTLHQVPGYFHQGEIKFDTFSAGQAAFKQQGWGASMMEEDFRYFVEECDNLQGVQCIADVHNGFAGITASMLENVREELPKAHIVVFAIRENAATNASKALVNYVDALQSLSETASIVTPLIVPQTSDLNANGWSRYITSDMRLPYHSSAWLAAAVESVTVPYRLKQHSGHRLANLCSALNWRGQCSLVSCSAGLIPLSSSRSAELTARKEDMQQPLWRANAWPLNVSTRVQLQHTDVLFAQTVTVRGAQTSAMSPLTTGFVEEAAAGSAQSALDALGQYFGNVRAMRTQSFACREPFSVPDAFPYIFSTKIQRNGLVDLEYAREEPGPSSIPWAVQLSTLSTTGRDLDRLRQQIHDLSAHGWARLRGGGHIGDDTQVGTTSTSFDDWTAAQEWLAETASAYAVDDDNGDGSTVH
ncbi:mtDNA inheritance, partitioning of the mitochondrial organelle [Sorochytrium milnesiophthora]